jgi:hypothetical protein
VAEPYLNFGVAGIVGYFLALGWVRGGSTSRSCGGCRDGTRAGRRPDAAPHHGAQRLHNFPVRRQGMAVVVVVEWIPVRRAGVASMPLRARARA